MLRVFVITLAIFFLQESSPAIITPHAGATLRGRATIIGNTDIPNFASAELDFAYASDKTSTWFLIETFSQPVSNNQLTVWDTSSLTDGIYNLRLRIFLQDGTTQDVIVKDLNLQNNAAPIPTQEPTLTPTPQISSSPAALPPTSTPVPSPTDEFATATPFYPTPTAFPINPASLNEASILSIFKRGALLTVLSFVVIGLFLRLRRSNS